MKKILASIALFVLLVFVFAIFVFLEPKPNAEPLILFVDAVKETLIFFISCFLIIALFVFMFKLVDIITE